MTADIQIDQETCIGCGLCVSIVPELFHLNAARVAEVLARSDRYVGRIQEAVESCPVNCMYWR